MSVIGTRRENFFALTNQFVMLFRPPVSAMPNIMQDKCGFGHTVNSKENPCAKLVIPSIFSSMVCQDQLQFKHEKPRIRKVIIE